MHPLVTLKTILITVIAIAASTGASTIYFQLKASDLNNQLTTVNDQLTKSNNQVSQLSNQTSRLQSSNLQLTNTNTQLTAQVQLMQIQLANLTTQIATLTTKISVLTLHPPTNETTIASGSLTVPFNQVSYLPFNVPSLTATLNITFTITTTTQSSYPQTIALYLLDLTQHSSFLKGNYTSYTWTYPYSTVVSTTQIHLPTSGNWYLAFQDHDEWAGRGFLPTVTYTVQLT